MRVAASGCATCDDGIEPERTGTDPTRSHQAARLLSSAVPPDSRERSLVGPRLYRMDERRESAPPFCRPCAAASPVRARLLRPPCTRGSRGTGRSGPCLWHLRLLLLPLLV